MYQEALSSNYIDVIGCECTHTASVMSVYQSHYGNWWTSHTELMLKAACMFPLDSEYENRDRK